MTPDTKKPRGRTGALPSDLLGVGTDPIVGHDADTRTALWAESRVTSLLACYQDKDVRVPEYGSDEWHDLPSLDPRRLAAVIEAAEQWRRMVAYRLWLDTLDPDEWFSEITADADAYARKVAASLGRMKTAAEQRAARSGHGPVHQLKATKDWPPIRIPGQPSRHLVHDEKGTA